MENTVEMAGSDILYCRISEIGHYSKAVMWQTLICSWIGKCDSPSVLFLHKANTFSHFDQHLECAAPKHWSNDTTFALKREKKGKEWDKAREREKEKSKRKYKGREREKRTKVMWQTR